MQENYVPSPVDTGDVQLPPELAELTEELAENVHEAWARSRMEDGWTWGPARDDEKKTTPCMVPYSCLPEEEKAYDRTTALETVRLILKLGYTIQKGEAKP